MERNFKPIEISKNIFHIEYQYYSTYFNIWKTTIFKDWNNDILIFYNKENANDWIKLRIEIMSI